MKDEKMTSSVASILNESDGAKVDGKEEKGSTTQYEKSTMQYIFEDSETVSWANIENAKSGGYALYLLARYLSVLRGRDRKLFLEDTEEGGA